MVDATRQSPLFQAIVDWLNGAVVILNRQRQIVLASPQFARMLDLPDASALLGCRPGEALACLIDADGCTKIADFGVAKRMSTAEQQLTAGDAVIGTFSHMAPEQALSPQQVDVRADLHALGSTFFELLVGHQPFDGPDQQAILSRKLVGAAPPLRAARGDVPALLGACIDSLLANQVSERPQDPEELIRRLRPLAEQVGASRSGWRLAGSQATRAAACAVSHGMPRCRETGARTCGPWRGRR
jgi:hypothetical protein